MRTAQFVCERERPRLFQLMLPPADSNLPVLWKEARLIKKVTPALHPELAKTFFPVKNEQLGLSPQLAAAFLEIRQALNTKLGPVTVSAPKKYSVDFVKGTLTQQGTSLNAETSKPISITVPFGVTRLNAATFKELCGKPNDTLLWLGGDRWVPVSDDCEIDLTDPRNTFKIGSVQVYS